MHAIAAATFGGKSSDDGSLLALEIGGGGGGDEVESTGSAMTYCYTRSTMCMSSQLTNAGAVLSFAQREK